MSAQAQTHTYWREFLARSKGVREEWVLEEHSNRYGYPFFALGRGGLVLSARGQGVSLELSLRSSCCGATFRESLGEDYYCSSCLGVTGFTRSMATNFLFGRGELVGWGEFTPGRPDWESLQEWSAGCADPLEVVIWLTDLRLQLEELTDLL